MLLENVGSYPVYPSGFLFLFALNIAQFFAGSENYCFEGKSIMLLVFVELKVG